MYIRKGSGCTANHLLAEYYLDKANLFVIFRKEVPGVQVDLAHWCAQTPTPEKLCLTACAPLRNLRSKKNVQKDPCLVFPSGPQGHGQTARTCLRAFRRAAVAARIMTDFLVGRSLSTIFNSITKTILIPKISE